MTVRFLVAAALIAWAATAEAAVDRAVLPDVHHKISAFFLRHLSPR